MNKVEEAMEGYWGKRCPDHEPECVVCKAWEEYDTVYAEKFAQCWTVEAHEARGDDTESETGCFRWVFVQREYANHVYNMGKKELPHMRWSFTVTPFGNVEHALHDIKYLKDFEATKEEV